MPKTLDKVPPREVVIIIFDGVQPIDFSGPAQTLTTANEEGAASPYVVRLHAPFSQKVQTTAGFFVCSEPVSAEQVIDTLIIPGGPGVHDAAQKNPIFLEALRKLCARARRVCSVCTGAFLLAQIGLLAQKRVVTHWRSCNRLAQDFPDVRVEPDSLYVKDGEIWTSAGVTAGIDLTLALVQEDHDASLAARVARRLVIYLRRPGGQKQFSEPLSLQETAGSRYAPLLQQLSSTPWRPWSVDDMALAAGQSLRSFHRQFKNEVGTTPSKALERIRTELAHNYLQTTEMRLKQVAVKIGFESEDALRNAMVRQFGVTAKEIRERFSASK